MSMTNPPWTAYSPQQPVKRKRAEAACVTCHSKKTRCDFVQKKSQGYEACTACVAANSVCRNRVTKRERARQSQFQHDGPSRNASGENDGNDANLDVVDRGRSLQSSATPWTVQRASPSLDANTSINIPTQKEPHRHSSTVAANSPQMQHPMLPAQQDDATYSNTSVSLDSSGTAIGNMSGYVVDIGFLNVYRSENEQDANQQATDLEHTTKPPELIRPELLQTFAETYFEYCYPWCPVLNKSDLFDALARSPLLADALAVAASHVQPPIHTRADPAEYYNRARRRFYEDEESDVMVSLRAISLFYWWSSRSPARVHRHSSWWWTSVIIRHAQQLGVHREMTPSSTQSALSSVDMGLRRRLWWTAFARERLTAVCQGKPCIINVDDCTIKEPSLDDFPPDADQSKAEIFIYWVRLCGVYGKVAKYLAKVSLSSPVSPSDHPGKDLVAWVNSLPSHLRLPIESDRTINFNRDVHQLHLPYLAVIIVLHLKRSEESLPIASSTAILAATCIARIFKDLLLRGSTRFLMAISSWYCAIAFIALSNASRVANLRVMAEEELDILYATIRELQKMWGTANIFEQGFRRLRATLQNHEAGPIQANDNTNNQTTQSMNLGEDGDMNWGDCFPFATSNTSPIARVLFSEHNGMSDLFADLPSDFITLLYPELLESFEIVDTNLAY